MNQSLVVEDDAALREALADTLRAAGITAIGGRAMRARRSKLLETRGNRAWSFPTCKCPARTATSLLSSIKRLRADLPVVLMTAYGTVAQAVSAMREGATDYIVKPFDAQGADRHGAPSARQPGHTQNELVAADPGIEAHGVVSRARSPKTMRPY
jgi:two-component system response regulator FlrC